MAKRENVMSATVTVLSVTMALLVTIFMEKKNVGFVKAAAIYLLEMKKDVSVND